MTCQAAGFFSKAGENSLKISSALDCPGSSLRTVPCSQPSVFHRSRKQSPRISPVNSGWCFLPQPANLTGQRCFRGCVRNGVVIIKVTLTPLCLTDSNCPNMGCISKNIIVSSRHRSVLSSLSMNFWNSSRFYVIFMCCMSCLLSKQLKYSQLGEGMQHFFIIYSSHYQELINKGTSLV